MRQVLNCRGIYKPLIFLLKAVLIIYIPIFVLYILIDLNMYKDTHNAYLFVELIVYVLGYLVFWIFYKRDYLNLKYVPVKNESVKIHLYVIVAIILFSYALLESIYIPATSESTNRTTNDMVVFCISTLVYSPVFEEVLFRGIVFEHLLKTSSRNTSFIFVSLAFAILHYEPKMIIGAFIFSIILCEIYYTYRSVLLCIWGHFIFNSSGFILDLLNRIGLIAINYNYTTNKFELPVILEMLSHICFFLSVLIYILLRKSKKSRDLL